MQGIENNSMVSIIVPAYNYGRYLPECLDSVLNQTYTNWECIVIDNGSTDDTSSIAQSFVSKDKRFSYYFTEQKGVSFARNKAVSLSKGMYIFPLDADDKIAPTYIEKALKIIESEEHIKVVYCDAELFGARKGKWKLPTYAFKNLLIENSIFCTALYRKVDFYLARGYNEEMKEGFEDWDFWISMLQHGGEVYKIDEPLFYYRMREDSRNGALDTNKQLLLRRQVYENHKEVYEKYFSIPDLLFENYNLNLAMNTIKNSADLRTANTILKPLRAIKNLLFGKKK
jgi:glycosyltransferase involved in cell wall biosynthesis